MVCQELNKNYEDPIFLNKVLKDEDLPYLINKSTHNYR